MNSFSSYRLGGAIMAAAPLYSFDIVFNIPSLGYCKAYAKSQFCAILLQNGMIRAHLLQKSQLHGNAVPGCFRRIFPLN